MADILEWNVNLGAMNVYELSQWILSQRRKAIVNGELNGVLLEQLFDEWCYLYEATEKPLAHLHQDERKQRQDNRRVLKSEKYRKAIALLNLPLPRFKVHIRGEKHPTFLSYEVYQQNRDLSIRQALRQVDDDVAAFDSIMKHGDYRKHLRERIKRREIEREIATYTIPGIKGYAPSKDYNKDIKDKKIYWDEADLDPETSRGGLRKLEYFGISRPHLKNWIDGKCEKPTMLRLAFFLGLHGASAEVLLGKEGFSLAQSIRPEDGIFLSCYKIGFPITYANFLLVRAKKKSLGNVDF